MLWTTKRKQRENLLDLSQTGAWNTEGTLHGSFLPQSSFVKDRLAQAAGVKLLSFRLALQVRPTSEHHVAPALIIITLSTVQGEAYQAVSTTSVCAGKYRPSGVIAASHRDGQTTQTIKGSRHIYIYTCNKSQRICFSSVGNHKAHRACAEMHVLHLVSCTNVF